MPRRSPSPPTLTLPAARRLWLGAQRLGETEPFGAGPAATAAAVQHLGYVQIDTINVIERCHHHILWSRIPDYRREDLTQAQSVDKSVFEYWTHALSYVPADDFRFFIPAMKRHAAAPNRWYAAGDPAELKAIVKRIRDQGPLTIRDIDDDVLVEKEHLWASRKPSKRALQHAFYNGALTIAARAGMLKTYELTIRHFGWDRAPAPATDRQVAAYLLDRALRAQGVVSLDSICHLDAPRKKAVHDVIETRVRQRRLVPVAIEEAGRTLHWAEPTAMETMPEVTESTVHILSPFDPLIIQRKRLSLFFGYDHLFEAYVPAEKRVLGYFALPVLVGDRIVAALDLKTDRAARALRIRRWTWTDPVAGPAHKTAIEAALHRFERFQLQGAAEAEEEVKAVARPRASAS